MKKKILQTGIMLLLVIATALQLKAQYPPPYIENPYGWTANLDDKAVDVVALCDGGYAWVGWESNPSGLSPVDYPNFGQARTPIVHCINEDGTTRVRPNGNPWIYKHPYSGYFNDVIVNAAGNIVAIGTARRDDPVPYEYNLTTEDRVLVVELDPCDMTVIHQSLFRIPFPYPGDQMHLRGKSIAQDPGTGKYFVCAEASSATDGPGHGYDYSPTSSVVLTIDVDLQYTNMSWHTPSLQGDGPWPVPGIRYYFSGLSHVVYTPGGPGADGLISTPDDILPGFIVCGFVTNMVPGSDPPAGHDDILVQKFSFGTPHPIPMWSQPVHISRAGGITALSGYSEVDLGVTRDPWGPGNIYPAANNNERADYVSLDGKGDIVVSGLFNFNKDEILCSWTTWSSKHRDADGVLIHIEDVPGNGTLSPMGSSFPNFNVAHFSGTDFWFKTEWDGVNNRFVSVGSNNDVGNIDPDERAYVIETNAPLVASNYDLTTASVTGETFVATAEAPLLESNGLGITTIEGSSCIAICGGNFNPAQPGPYPQLPTGNAIFELMCPQDVSPPSILTIDNPTPCLGGEAIFSMNVCPDQFVVLYFDALPDFADLPYIGAPTPPFVVGPINVMGTHTAYLRVYNFLPTNNTELENECFEVELDFEVVFCHVCPPEEEINLVIGQPVPPVADPPGLRYTFKNIGTSEPDFITWRVDGVVIGQTTGFGEIEYTLDEGTHVVCMEAGFLFPHDGHTECCYYDRCEVLHIRGCELWKAISDITPKILDINNPRNVTFDYEGFPGDNTWYMSIIWEFDGVATAVTSGPDPDYTHLFPTVGIHNWKATVVWSIGPWDGSNPGTCCCIEEYDEDVIAGPCGPIQYDFIMNYYPMTQETRYSVVPVSLPPAYSVVWNHNGAPPVTVPAPILSFTSPALLPTNICVSLMYPDGSPTGCTTAPVCRPIGAGGTISGIESVSKSERVISYYPNPTNGNVIVELTAEPGEKAAIEIIDYLGQSLLIKNYDNLNDGNNRLDLNIGDLASGLYQMKIIVGTESKVVKVVKQ